MEPILLEEALVKSWMPVRPETGHKGTFGKVCILAGCEGFTGAPVLASRAAVRGGTGLVFLQVPRCVYPIVAMKCNEAMPFPLPDQNGKVSLEAMDKVLSRVEECDALLMGPGLGRSGESDRLVQELTSRISKPLVLDADGLNAVSGHIDRVKQRTAVTILTPHDGEFRRLTGYWPAQSQKERRQQALALARDTHSVVVLKGHETIIADADGTVFQNTTGNAGMAKGGSGDVLGGLLVSFVAQGMEPVKAAAAAVWVHGRTGDLCAAELGQRAMTPSDMIDHFGAVLKSLEG